MELKIHNPSNLPLIDYRTVKPLQGKLKSMKPANYKKLKAVLEKRGFTVPLFVWASYNEIDSKPNESMPIVYLMDGHGRQKVMPAENATPYEVPYILIEADNIKDAKAQLLEITSQYNTITKTGFEEFTADMEATEFENVVFDAINLDPPRKAVNTEGTTSIVVTFSDKTQMEDCLLELQEICEKYNSAQIKVNE
jgi:hypothetical protein